MAVLGPWSGPSVGLLGAGLWLWIAITGPPAWMQSSCGHQMGSLTVAEFGAPSAPSAPSALAGYSTPSASATPTVEADRGPYPPYANPVFVPVVNGLGDHTDCFTAISVQSVGSEPGKAVLLGWPANPGCAPLGGGVCPVPIAILCSGLLRPGSAWTFPASSIPKTVRSAAIFSFNVRSRFALGMPPDGAPDLPMADYLCAHFAAGAIADCGSYWRFHQAYRGGLTWDDMAMGRSYGPDLAVSVQRRCGDPADMAVGVDRAAGGATEFAGLGGLALGQPANSRSTYTVYPAFTDEGGHGTVLYIQNADPSCVSVEVALQSADECKSPLLCTRFTLTPGTAEVVHPADCVPAGWRGAVWVTGDGGEDRGQLAIVAENVRDAGPGDFAAVPGELYFDRFAPPAFSPGSQVLFAPLPWGPLDGWEVRLHVQNLGYRDAARVQVTFADGDREYVLRVPDDTVCADGGQTFAFRPPEALMHPQAGSMAIVRVESQGYQPPGGLPVQGPNLAGVVELVHVADPEGQAGTRGRDGPTGARGQDGPVVAKGQAVLYSMLAEQQSFDWSVGSGNGGLASGRGRIALPRISRGARVEWPEAGAGGRESTRIVVSNVVPWEGSTGVLAIAYDANGAVDTQCLELAAQQSAAVDLDRWATLPMGFRGSAVISALWWNHPVVIGPGNPPPRNLLGLAVIAVHELRPGDATTDTQSSRFTVSVGVPLWIDRSTVLPELSPALRESIECAPAPTSVPRRPLGAGWGTRVWLPQVMKVR